MVLFDKQPDEIHYWNAVRGEISFIQGGTQWGGHGRIGAAASCSWRALMQRGKESLGQMKIDM